MPKNYIDMANNTAHSITYRTRIIASIALLLVVSLSFGSAKDKTEKDSTSKEPQKSPYEKIFSKKEVKSSKGLMTLHNVEGKLYIEVPLNLFGQSFLMSSVVDNVSDMTLAYAGQRSSRPKLITFTRTDSLVNIALLPVMAGSDGDEPGVRRAIENSTIPSIIHSSPIAAYNPDSTAIVFEATSFFISGSKYIGTLNASSFGGFIQMVSTFSKDLSSLARVDAYPDNISVTGNMTYSFKTYFMGMESGGSQFLTAELRTTIKQLQSKRDSHADLEYVPHPADYRIGTGVVQTESFGSKDNGTIPEYFATRWNTKKGPILFYVDTLFPPTWRAAVKRGLLKWNKSFAEVGLKDMIVVKDYPSPAEDSLFSSANSSYNCVKYAQIPSRDIGHQVNVDPRTGEILSASILFFKDSPVTLQRERLYQTAAVEPAVRDFNLPDDLMCNSIELAMMREMGFCLGLTANLAGTSWIPVDSLRSATFTAKEGITSSVMDQIRYNYVAQPGDIEKGIPSDIEKGVPISVKEPAIYDKYVIDWLYGECNDKAGLKAKIKAKEGDPRFRYGMAQKWSGYFDPRAVAENLGNDQIKATEYGITTLKYICANATKWINKDEADDSYRELFIDFIFLKLYDYYKSIMVNIGGIEINNNYDDSALSDPIMVNSAMGDPIRKGVKRSYKVVDRATQRASLLYMLNRADSLQWMDQKDLMMMSGMNSSLSRYLVNNLVTLVFQRLPNVAFASKLQSIDAKNSGLANSDSNHAGYSFDEIYSLNDMIEDLKDFALKNISEGRAPSEAQIATLTMLTKVLIADSELPEAQKAKQKNAKAIFDFAGANYELNHNIAANHAKLANRMLYAGLNTGIVDYGLNTGIVDAGLKKILFGSEFNTNIFGSESNIEILGSESNMGISDNMRSAYEPLTSIKYLTFDNLAPEFYGHLLDIHERLTQALPKCNDSATQSRVLYMINVIDKAMK